MGLLVGMCIRVMMQSPIHKCPLAVSTLFRPPGGEHLQLKREHT